MSEVDSRYFKCEIPEAASGEWTVARFRDGAGEPTTDRRPRFAWRRPGVYTVLRRGETVFMTDLYEEWWTQKSAIDEACRRGGHILVTGLGLGMIVESMLRPSESAVEKVTVLELSPDVIQLTAPHLEARFGHRFEVIETDAFTWQPPAGARYSVGWHDIWPDPYGEVVAGEIARLEDRYRPFCDWQGSWPARFLAEFSRPAGAEG